MSSLSADAAHPFSRATQLEPMHRDALDVSDVKMQEGCSFTKNHMFFDIERCEMPAIRTLAAMRVPAMQLRAILNR